MSVNKTKLNWIKHSCLIGATCLSMNVFAGEATVWSDSAGDVVTDGAGDCLHTIWWKKGGGCGNEDVNPDTHKHAASAGQSAAEHTHDGGSKAHQHEPAKTAASTADTNAAAASAAAVMVPFSLSSSAAFKPTSADLSAEGKAEVKAFADKLEGHEVNSITVEGYTDSRGSSAYNQDLSEKRANAVKDEMISNGIDGGLITAIGRGESSPIADNETSAGRAKNRRVIVSVDAKN